jgi:putative nucleotidyltransferase with HDIG domain
MQEIGSAGAAASAQHATDGHVIAVLGTLTAGVRGTLGVDRVCAFLRDEADPRALVIVAAVGVNESVLGTSVGIDEGITGRVLATGDPVLIEEADWQKAMPPELSSGAHGAAWAPFGWGGSTRGVLFAATERRERRLGRRDLELLGELATLMGTAAEHAEMRERLEGTLNAGIEALASLIDLRDGYTGRHSDQVVSMARRLGERLGVEKRDLAEVCIAARLHDIGKIGVPDNILLKPGPLTPTEQNIVRCHTDWGADTLDRIPGLRTVAEAVRHHHERWDGRGYPAGLAGEDIPLASRIIGVCDAFGAMTSTRPYRRALGVDQAVRLLQAGAGAQFDARAVRAMCQVLDEGGFDVPTEKSEPDGSAPEPGKALLGTQSVPRPRPHQPLVRAFERLEALPALSESRQRVLALLGDQRSSAADIVVTIESDAALAIAVLRAANRLPGPRRGKIAGVPEALRVLSPEGTERLVSRVATFEFFQRIPGWETPEHFRLHAVAAQQIAARIARSRNAADRDALMVAALLHDVGKLVLADAYRDYPVAVHRDAKTPEERLQAEQRHLGVDHAAVGGVLIRRWGLPDRIASAVERHHVARESGDAAVVRLADMLANYAQGNTVAPRELERAGRSIGLDARAVRSLMFELPLPVDIPPRAHEPSPLSRQETRALRELAKGKVYKEIAAELGLAPSTVRSHLHACYEKLGAADRAQAVLIATDKGWL